MGVAILLGLQVFCGCLVGFPMWFVGLSMANQRRRGKGDVWGGGDQTVLHQILKNCNSDGKNGIEKDYIYMKTHPFT